MLKTILTYFSRKEKATRLRMFCKIPKLNTETKQEASSYAKQMYSLLPSIGKNVYNIS